MNQEAIVKPCSEKIVKLGNIYCRFNENIAKNFVIEFFNSHYWQKKQAIVGTAQGRGTTYFIKHEMHQWVLKHYFRGGLIGKLINDHYVFVDMNKTRAIKEYKLLKEMQSLGLPVPTPVAVRIIKHLITYQADILTSRITDAKDVVGILTESSIKEELWQEIGKTIKQFHQQGIYHDDLNCHNILIDKNKKIWLIDFDRGEQKVIDKNWQEKNLERLLRSFKKEKGRLDNLHWHTNDWQHLINGYNQHN